MRPGWLFVLLLSGCALDDGGQCGEAFCMPARAEMIGKQEIADFNIYQVLWSRARLGIYEGDHPDFSSQEAERISITLDPNAELLIDGEQAQVLARVRKELPQYIHLTGPCSSRANCLALEAAKSLTPASDRYC